MNKAKSIIVAAGVSLALAFTFSCGEVEGDFSSNDGNSSSVAANNSSGGSSSSVTASSSSSANVQDPNVTFVDERDGKIYKWVKIGTQTWMAENLNYDVPNNTDDVCYDNDPANCAIYGRLYDWATAMNFDKVCNNSDCRDMVNWRGHRGICPSGWHLPSAAEPNLSEWKTLADYVGGASTAGTKLKATSGWNEDGNGTDDFGFSALPGGFGYSHGSFGNVGNNGIWWSSTEYDRGNAWDWGTNYTLSAMVGGSQSKSHQFSVRCVKD